MVRKYWKCANCGSIHVKDEIMRFFVEGGSAVAGGVTCSACLQRYQAAAVAAGAYDLETPDDAIDRMLSDVANVSADRNRMVCTTKA